jgi:hypothetical protein
MSGFENKQITKYRILFLDVFIDYFEWIYPDKNLTQLQKKCYGKDNFQ